MKKLFVFLLLMGASVFAQQKQKQVVTDTLKVAGNCEECKTRIENAADIKGVKASTWDAKSQLLIVTYRADKVSIEKIKSAIKKAGHDVEEGKADEAAYNDLPGCCKYRDNKCEKK